MVHSCTIYSCTIYSCSIYSCTIYSCQNNSTAQLTTGAFWSWWYRAQKWAFFVKINEKLQNSTNYHHISSCLTLIWKGQAYFYSFELSGNFHKKHMSQRDILKYQFLVCNIKKTILFFILNYF